MDRTAFCGISVCIFGSLRATGVYMFYVMYHADQVWSEAEIREELTDAEIAAINAALK